MSIKDNKPDWCKKRHYNHFDNPCYGLSHVTQYVTNPDTVRKHGFFPLIKYTIETRKVSRAFDEKQNFVKLENKIKKREIAYACHLDSHIYSYYSSLLGVHYEGYLEKHGIRDCVLAFRKLGKSNVDFAKSAFDNVKIYGSCTVVALDVTGFFDNLDHEILKQNWNKIVNKGKLPDDHFVVYRSVTRYSFVQKDKLYEILKLSQRNPKLVDGKLCSSHDFRSKVRKNGLIERNLSGKGIPQGLPISSILSNIYMIDFDKNVSNFISNFGGIYFRYCDDMIFILPDGVYEKAKQFIFSEIQKVKLEINDRKTEIRQFYYNQGILKCDKPLQYLGFIFNGENVYIRSSSLTRYHVKMRRGVRRAGINMRNANKKRRIKKQPELKIYRNKIYRDYSHLGKRNFVRYGYRAADKFDSKSMRKQLSKLWHKLQKEIKINDHKINSQ